MANDAPAWHRKADRPADTAAQKMKVRTVRKGAVTIPAGGSDTLIVGWTNDSDEVQWIEQAGWSFEQAFTTDVGIAFIVEEADGTNYIEIDSTVQSGQMHFDPAIPVPPDDNAAVVAANFSGADVSMNGSIARRFL